MTAQSKALRAQSEGVIWDRSMAYQITLRQKLNVTVMLKELMLGASGLKELSNTQVQCIRIALGKVMPDLQAVQVSVETNAPASKADIDALLLAAGLDPESEWNHDSDVIEAVPDNGHESEVVQNGDDLSVQKQE